MEVNQTQEERDQASRDAAVKGGVTVNGKPIEPRQEEQQEPQDENSNDNQKGGEEETPKERPENVPEKFWNAETGEVDYEAMAKSYSELEKRLSQGNEPEDDSKDTSDGESEDDNSGEGSESDATSAFSAAQAEFAEKGELSDDTIAQLEKAGVSRNIIDTYLQGVQALSQNMANEAYQMVGGEDQYKAMIEWASENLTADEIKAYDEAVMNPNQSRLAIAGLKAQYQEATKQERGVEQDLSTNRSESSNGGVQPFKSSAEMRTAMSDPRYKTDEAYRQEVMNRLRMTKDKSQLYI